MENKIIEKLKNEEIKMRPRSYFILRSLLFVLGTIFVFLLSFFLVSLIIFILRFNGSSLLPKFGFRGIGILLTSFPWLLAITALLFIVVLEVFAKHYKFIYQKPLLYSVVGITIIVLLGGLLFMKIPLHGKVLENKTISSLYGKENLRNSQTGQVLKITETGFIIKSKDGKIFTVKTEVENIKEGDWVIVIGEKENDLINARGVKKIEPEKDKRLYKMRGVK